jgi:hypothetical protein
LAGVDRKQAICATLVDFAAIPTAIQRRSISASGGFPARTDETRGQIVAIPKEELPAMFSPN